MHLLPIAAGVPFEGLIWFIIITLWAVAQIVNKTRLRRGPSPPPTGREAMPEELREIFETLTGQKIEVAAEEPPPPPVVQRVPPQRAEAPRAKEHRAPKARTSRLPPPIPQPSFLSATAEAPALADVGGPRIVARQSLSDAFMSTKGVFTGMKGLQMPGLTQGLRTLRTESRGHPLFTPSELRQKQRLRKYILGSAVLGPCKAFDYGLPR